MSTALIVLIVVVVVVLVALAFVLPRARRGARLQARQNEIGERRERVVDEHRGAAQERAQQAEIAERRARMAEQEAARERAQAQLEHERAEVHARGLADHELVSDEERERFAGTSAVETDRGDASVDGGGLAGGRNGVTGNGQTVTNLDAAANGRREADADRDGLAAQRGDAAVNRDRL